MRHERNSTGDLWKVSMLLRSSHGKSVLCFLGMLLCLMKASYYHLGSLLEDKTNILMTAKQRDEDNLSPLHLEYTLYYSWNPLLLILISDTVYFFTCFFFFFLYMFESEFSFICSKRILLLVARASQPTEHGTIISPLADGSLELIRLGY